MLRKLWGFPSRPGLLALSGWRAEGSDVSAGVLRGVCGLWRACAEREGKQRRVETTE